MVGGRGEEGDWEGGGDGLGEFMNDILGGGSYHTVDGRKARVDRWERGVYHGWVADPTNRQGRATNYLRAEWDGLGICKEKAEDSIVATVLSSKFCKMLSITRKQLDRLEELGELEGELKLPIPVYKDKKSVFYNKKEAKIYARSNKRRLEALVEKFRVVREDKSSVITLNTDTNLGLAFLTGRLR